MFAIFLESFLLSIAKHGAEEQGLQVAGQVAGELKEDERGTNALGQHLLRPLVTVARCWFLHIVTRW